MTTALNMSLQKSCVILSHIWQYRAEDRQSRTIVDVVVVTTLTSCVNV